MEEKRSKFLITLTLVSVVIISAGCANADQGGNKMISTVSTTTLSLEKPKDKLEGIVKELLAGENNLKKPKLRTLDV